MPLHHKQPFERISPPEDLNAEEELFHCKITSEVFREYDKFFDRVILCNSLVWTCSLTGKSGLTFQEALDSENNARGVLAKFPESLKKPLLYLASCTSRGRLNDMCDDVYNFVKERFFENEDVEVTLNGIKKTCTVKKVIPDKDSKSPAKRDVKNKSPLKGLNPDKTKYEVVEKNRGASTVVKSSCISRTKGSFTRANNKLFLKSHTVSEKGIWKVVNTAAEKFKLKDFRLESPHASPLPRCALSPLIKKKAPIATSTGVRKKSSSLSTDSSQGKKKSVQGKLNFKKETEEERLRKLELEQEEFEKQRDILEKNRQEKRDEVKRRMEEDRERIRQQKLQEREKKKEEKKQMVEYMNSWKKPRDDLECDDLKDLPKPSPVECAISQECFGEAVMVLEFLDKFSALIKLKDSFPHGFSFDHLEKALTETDIQGFFSDLIQLLLASLFRLKDFDDIKGEKKPLKIPDVTAEMTTEESEKVADAALMWSQTYHGTPLDKMYLDSFSISEILRLHILASGSTKDNSYMLGLNGVSEDPGFSFKWEEQALLNKLSTISIFELNCEDRLKILRLLIEQLASCESIRNQLEENFAKARPLYYELKQIKWAIARLKKGDSLSGTNIKKKTDADSKNSEGQAETVKPEGNEEDAKLSTEAQQALDDKQQKEIAKKKAEYLKQERQIKSQIKKLQSSFQLSPIGRDRAFRRFWVFNSLSGIFVEDDDVSIGPCMPKETPQAPANATGIGRSDSGGGSIRKYLQHLGDAKNGSSDKENDILQDLAIIQNDFSIPINGRKLSDLNTRVDQKKTVADANVHESSNCVQCKEKKSEFQGSMPSYCPHSKNSAVFGLCTASIDTCSVHNLNAPRTKWAFYYKTEDLESLLSSLNPRGFREGALRKTLLSEKEVMIDMLSKCQYQLLSRSLPPSPQIEVRKSQRNTVNPRKSPFANMDPAIALEVTLRDTLLELEQRIYSGGLGCLKVDCRETWRDRVEQRICQLVPSEDTTDKKSFTACDDASVINELASCLKNIAEGIEPKFLIPPLSDNDPSKPKKEKGPESERGSTNGHITRFENWRLSLMECTSVSQLFVYLGTLERSVAWARSILKAHCRLCRRKGDGENMLLCDGCNRGHHLYCLKPPLEQIPEGDWFCKDCHPPEKVLSPRKMERPNYAEIEEESESDNEELDMESNVDSEASDDEAEEVGVEFIEEVCEICDEGGTVICCDKCPRLYHQECVGLRRIPRGQWLCPLCSKRDQVLKKTEKHSPSGSYGTRAQTLLENAKKFVRTPVVENAKKFARTPIIGNKIKVKASKRKRSPSPDPEPLPTLRQRPVRNPVKKLCSDDKKTEENPFKKVFSDTHVNRIRRTSKSTGTSDILDYVSCSDLLTDLMHNPSSWPFLAPVTKKCAPGYHAIIKHPMDFGTIKSKLNDMAYKKNEDVIRDILQVFHNCETFNGMETLEYQAGSKLQKEFSELVLKYNLLV